MPVSKRRKTATSKPRRIPITVPPKTEKWTAALNGSRLIYLRNDPDFLTIIKVGRVINAVSYSLTDLASYDAERSVVGTRQYRRACFVLAGYLHEGVKLVQSVKGRYLTASGFEPLRELALAAEHKKVRSYLNAIRNVTAFHLDEIDETTRQTLARLKPTTFPFMSGDDNRIASYYFEFSDYMDMSFLVERFSDGRPWEETAEDILNSTMGFAEKFLIACHDFQLELCEKIKIGKHVY